MLVIAIRSPSGTEIRKYCIWIDDIKGARTHHSFIRLTSKRNCSSHNARHEKPTVLALFRI